MSIQKYIYHGDRYGKLGIYAGRICTAVKRENGKCIRGRNSNMLMDFDGVKVVLPARMLKKIKD